jgi:hypothetical protein
VQFFCFELHFYDEFGTNLYFIKKKLLKLHNVECKSILNWQRPNILSKKKGYWLDDAVLVTEILAPLVLSVFLEWQFCNQFKNHDYQFLGHYVIYIFN